MTQLSLLPVSPPPPAPGGLPPAIADILHAARSIGFQTRIVRGCWGIGVGPKRKWMLTGDCCCALAALIVLRGAEAEEHDNTAHHAAAKLLGCTTEDVFAFLGGFDYGRTGSEWARYGKMVAEELGI